MSTLNGTVRTLAAFHASLKYCRCLETKQKPYIKSACISINVINVFFQPMLWLMLSAHPIYSHWVRLRARAVNSVSMLEVQGCQRHSPMAHFEHFEFQGQPKKPWEQGLISADKYTGPQLFPKQHLPLTVEIRIQHVGTVKVQRQIPS